MTVVASRLLLVGCGKMGGALLRGIHAAKAASHLTVIEPGKAPEYPQIPDVVWHARLDELDASYVPDVVLIAVKPQVIPEILPAYAKFPKAVFLSIAAGVTLEKLGVLLGNPNAAPNIAIVRSMPNLPASMGAGASAAVANRYVTESQREICTRLLAAAGLVVWLEDENLLEAVTALSGSGPAYVFALCEAMAKAGETLGLAPDMAARLARQTIIGAGALMAHSKLSATELRQAVTSPKGTTEAALQSLMGEQGLDQLLHTAMAAAAARSRELSR